ncbi:D-2-hydroxyacid dehydrogenase [Pleionea sp. CnH1-48]|uniref:D-2-hydroxyacid dehydrogenase n=1 Tax=Pleionea sp. CnH1-48 TaxID=2954494 RepID=UPI002096F43E|nr:D-2-hydroxyacid dehydrogenase [Pleionea sp. CnH1-48]MCO7227107.1 D-2-hydroxyacid dehydrogenase [Pleionea sp. CnH1-48]
MKAVFLDAGTLVPGNAEPLTSSLWDIDISALEQSTSDIAFHYHTQAQDVVTRCQDADIVITNKVVIDADVLSQLPQLKLICVAATGINNIDLNAAQNQNIAVTNVAGYSTDSVVQICFTLILSLQHKLTQIHHDMNTEGWQNQSQFVWLSYPFHELKGKTLGIIGHGTIGKAVATVARAFGMNVVIAQLPHRPPQAGRMPLDDLLGHSDIVSLHCPLNEDTHQMVDAAFLGKMKKTALIINTARGGLIDEAALRHALLNNEIAGAGVDVLSTEPPAQNNPLLDNRLTNLLITPHIGWASIEARQTLVNEIAENIRAYTAGKSRNRMV